MLAGRDGPSVLDTEATFEAVMAEVEPPRRRRRWAWLGLPAAAAAALLFTVSGPPEEPGFAPRGAVEANVEPVCVRGEAPAPCAAGATLLFDVTAPEGRPYFAAFARRPDGAVIWYRPAEGATSEPQDGLTDQGFALGSEHPAGDYEVYGVFSARPMTRAALEAELGDALESTDDVRVVKRRLEVGP